MTETLSQIRDRYYAEAMRQFAETEAFIAANPNHRTQVRMGDGKLIYVERHPELGIYVEVQERKEAPPAAYVTDDYGRTLPVTWDMLRNRGGERIWLARAMHEPAEMDRLKAVLMEAYPLDE